MWVSTADLETFQDSCCTPAEDAATPFRDDEHDLAQIPQPLDPKCHYGEQSTARASQVPRDTGGRIDAGAWVTRSVQAGRGPVALAPRYVVPPELVDLRVAFLRAEEQCAQISDVMPSALAVVTGAAQVDQEMRDSLHAARTARLEIVQALFRHPWWSTVDNRFAAERELRNAALEVMPLSAP